MKQRASNNRTLLLEDAERPALRTMLKSIEDLRQENPSPWLDAVICADMLEAMRLIPDEMADLIILDPPYNLTRDFGGSSFVARNDQEYEEYLRSWMHTVCRKLKPSGSLYLCGDWRCTAAMQRVLCDELTILNRITWQREKGRGAKSNWKNSMEDIWFAVKDPQLY